MSADPPPEAAWRRSRELLARALELDLPEREKLLAELRATDPAQARDLEELLRADGVGGSFLDGGAAALVAALGEGVPTGPRAADAMRWNGQRLGVWQLHEPLGQGGMGTVYRAERADGTFAQEAAVKVLRRSVDTPELQRRFLRERQLLASLDHPAIVKVLDGGVTEEGLPWFALERVDGVPITRYAAERALDLRSRLRLMVEVCEAVDAAHRRLVVHRDLKPSNLLVTADGRVKLLDFGIAKVLEEEEGEALTRSESRLLTPQYAAPEQILGEPVTTAVDVYALGVLLYELLTGEVPHRRSTATPAGLAQELARETTRPPSRKLLESPGTSREVRQRARSLAGDLDAVVLKALRVDPEARYRSATELAGDLGAYLDGRPVSARRGSRLYSTRKLVLRHRAAAAAGAGVLLAVAAGLVAVAYEARVARAERDQARIQAATARHVSDFLTHLFQQADPAHTRGAQLTAREVLVSGAQRIDKELAAEPEVQATLRLAIGGVERDLGLYEDARPLLEQALAQRHRQFGDESLPTAEALYELGSLDRYLDRLDDGRRNLEQALRIRERDLGSNDLDVARSHSALGVVLRYQGDPPAARHEFERALAIAHTLGVEGDETGRWQNNLGLVLDDVGEYPAAEAAYRRAIEILERSSGKDSPLIALPLDNLGALLRAEERFDEAEPVLTRAVDLVRRTWGEQHAQYATALNSLANLLIDRGRCTEAIPLFAHSAAIFSAALGPDHRYTAYPVLNEGRCRLALGEPARALELFRRALEIREHGSADGVDAQVAQSLGLVGQALVGLGRLAEAEDTFRRTLAMTRKAVDANDPPYGDALFDLADCLERRHARDEARGLYQEALGIYRKAYPPGHSSIDKVLKALARVEPAPG